MEIEGLEEFNHEPTVVTPPREVILQEGPVRKPCPRCGKEFAWLADGSRPRQHKCGDKVDEVPQAKATPGEVTPEVVIGAYVRTRDEIADLEKQIKALKVKQTAKEDWLAAVMTKNGETAKKTHAGGCNFRTTASVTVADWEIIWEWVHSQLTERKHFLDRKVSKSAVVDYLEEHNVLPPGVNHSLVTKVTVTRPK